MTFFMKSSNSRDILRFGLLAISLLLLFPAIGFASGWNDFQFDIDEHYIVLRANSLDIHIWKKTDPMGGIESRTKSDNEFPSKDAIGPLYEICVDEHYIFAKCHAMKDAMKIDPLKTYYFIIDKQTDKAQGPCSENEFEAKIKDLPLAKPLSWQTLRQAYKQALRDGRADKNQVNVAAIGQLWFSAFSLPFVAIFATIPATLIGIVISGIKKRKAMEFSFGKCLLFSWLIMVSISYGGLLLIILSRWLYMKY